ncbi:hypothetical protein Nepgr_033228 [Nepenthes gracilis]|uniref:C2H2-type domain-containing protein n=1 Tax=Nepenthes gracilis TaxID=150966 RepID=A0AAD3TK48_NEPGR|nr:hypothetical protein Nepgr_033228 [Nepenthes gracilis]
MASTTIDALPERLSIESIPAVDLRLLSQSELTSLARCSSRAFDLRRCDDVVIPKIDRSVFNESAGSRKQTYSRLRLAPRKPDLSSKPRHMPEPMPEDAERGENARIISLFKQLFNSGSQNGESIPINVEYGETVPALPNVVVPMRIIGNGGERKRRRGRKPKSDNLSGLLALVPVDEAAVADNANNARVVDEEAEVREKEIVNKNGLTVDLAELAMLEDPYGAEIRRRTEGMEKDEELLGFLSGLNGQWGSRRKRRRIVDANEFGDALPMGWKLLVGMKKKKGQTWLFVRRYISPKGQCFVSCKDVSSYLFSLCGLQDAKCTTSNHCTEASLAVNESTSGYAADNHLKVGKASSFVTSYSHTQEKQFPLLESVNPGDLQGAGVFRCHKCSTPFSGEEYLLRHLLSCHKRKRRKSGVPFDDGMLMKNDKYECQFCHKTFHERHSYFGHVGIHVKMYVKRVGRSPGSAAEQKSSDPISSFAGPLAVLEMHGAIEMNDDSAAGTPDFPAADESIPLQSKLQAASDLKIHSDSCDTQVHNFSIYGEKSTEAIGTARTSVEQSLEKGGGNRQGTDNELGIIDGATGMSAVKLELCSDAEKGISSNDENDDIKETSLKTVLSRSASFGVNNNLIGQVGNAETCSPVEGEQTVEENNGNGILSGIITVAPEEIVSGSNLLSDNKEKAMSAENSDNRLSSDNVPEVQRDRGARLGDDAQLTIGSGCTAVSEGNDETCAAVDHIIGVVESTLAMVECKLESSSEPQSFTPHGDAVETYTGKAATSSAKEIFLETFSSEKDEATVGDSSGTKEGNAESDMLLPSGVMGSSCVVENGTYMDSVGTMPESEKEAGSKVDSFLPCIFQVDQTSAEDTLTIPTTKSEPPKSDEVGSNRAVLFAAESMDTNLGTDLVNNVGQGKISAVLESRQSLTEEPNLFGTCNSIVEESQPEKISRSVLSRLSVSEHMHDVSVKVHVVENNVNDVCAGTSAAQLPETDRVLSSRKKVILGFVDNMNEISTNAPTSVQHETISESSSPFSLWNEQSYGVDHSQSRVYDSTREEDRQERIALSNTLSLASFQETYDVGYNLNKSYMGTMEELSRLAAFDHSRDTDLMIGYRNNDDRPNQHTVTDVLWRSNDTTVVPGGLGDCSSSQGQGSCSFQPFDFLTDKGGNELYSVNDKFDSLSSFDGLRSAAVEPMEFSFLTAHDSTTQLGEPKVLSYNNHPEIEQGFDSSVWLDKGTSLSNLIGGNVVTIMCVWCGNEFHQDPVDTETQAGSIGYLCPACKGRIPGQFL